MKNNIRIGTCGFGMTKGKYSAMFSCVEIQQTFYQPPQIKTLEKWRGEVPEDFEFAVKAWQLITHEAKSPTYKRLKRQLTETEKSEAGRFQPTAIVNEAWETTLACANALRARRYFSNARRVSNHTPKISKTSNVFLTQSNAASSNSLRAARRRLD
jgi:uncharacterized protein YecE (DUF72 family)